MEILPVNVLRYSTGKGERTMDFPYLHIEKRSLLLQNKIRKRSLKTKKYIYAVLLICIIVVVALVLIPLILRSKALASYKNM